MKPVTGAAQSGMTSPKSAPRTRPARIAMLSRMAFLLVWNVFAIFLLLYGTKGCVSAHPFVFFFMNVDYFTASNAASRAAIRSFTFSVPMDRRIVFGLMPWSSSSSSVSWLWVVV